MKIGIDARSLSVPGGIKIYSENLLNCLNHKKEFILMGPTHFNDFKCIPSKIKNDSILRLFYENIIIPKIIKKNRVDLIHSLKSSVPILGKFKRVITVHDLNHYVNPHNYKIKDLVYWKYIFPHYVKVSDKIITISNNTKEDLIRFLNVDEGKIKVIYLAFDKKIYHKKNKSSSYNAVSKYLTKNNKHKINFNQRVMLSVNTIHPGKNISNIIKSFDLIVGKQKDIILVIIGKKGWKYREIFETYESAKNKDKIYFLGYVPDEVVANFYNITEALIYPSLYEGFGLPILEAQACGCPVITSNVSSMPEVAGKGAILVDPYNVDDIANAMLKITKDKKLRAKLIKEGYKNVKRFSWEKCAKETLKVYQEVLNEKD